MKQVKWREDSRFLLNIQAFNPGVNPNGDDDGDGYTNIEELLHEMAAQVEGR